MHSTDGAIDPGLRQARLASFGRMLALMTLVLAALNASMSVWLGRASFNRVSIPLFFAGSAFAALWLLLRGTSRTPRFVRIVELSTLFVGTAAFSTLALVMDLTASPDMIVRTALTFMLLVYAVYVPSTARRTLVVAALMTVPLLTCIFLAFSKWDPALYDPPAAIWPKGAVGDMAYPATFVSAVLWSIVVAMAASFSQTIYGLRKAVSDSRRLGQYTLEEQLGEGGMGVVYRASHAMLRRPTAIKLLHPDRSGKDSLARFEREVQRTAMLTHPNTITVFDYGRTTEGVFYYAMELLDGISLDEVVNIDGPQPEERVIHLLAQAAGSLAEAHDAGLIHRDVKPGNILVVDRGGIADLVKVLDFGLVKDIGAGSAAETALTVADSITGTPLYVAPETVTAPETVDARADIYALGAVGYWLLTGTDVFGGRTVLEALAHHVHSIPQKPSQRLGRPIAADLEAVILACLAKHPEDRPSSAHLLRAQLHACDAAGGWTNDRAAQWWAEHRAGIRTRAGRIHAPDAAIAAPRLTVTRLAD
ncbi:MAG: protein kinase domain-containing protein [Gemmatimonadaceae bacterium]